MIGGDHGAGKLVGRQTGKHGPSAVAGLQA